MAAGKEMFELFIRKPSGGKSRYNIAVEYVTIHAGGIRFNRIAYEAWLRGYEHAEVWVDREIGRVAVRPVSAPNLSSYRICKQGAIKQGSPTYYIPCRAVVSFSQAINGQKGSIVHTCAKKPGSDLIELIPVQREATSAK